MRIEAYNQVAQISNTSKVSRTQSTKSATGSRDEVSISQAGLDYQVAKKAVAESTDVRTDKVSALKQQIENGSYKVTADDFASKLIEKYNSLQ